MFDDSSTQCTARIHTFAPCFRQRCCYFNHLNGAVNAVRMSTVQVDDIAFLVTNAAGFVDAGRGVLRTLETLDEIMDGFVGKILPRYNSGCLVFSKHEKQTPAKIHQIRNFLNISSKHTAHTIENSIRDDVRLINNTLIERVLLLI